MKKTQAKSYKTTMKNTRKTSKLGTHDVQTKLGETFGPRHREETENRLLETMMRMDVMTNEHHTRR